jgi:hypothetical protein
VLFFRKEEDGKEGEAGVGVVIKSQCPMEIKGRRGGGGEIIMPYFNFLV